MKTMCSCVACHQLISIRGIHSHFLHKHSTEYKTKQIIESDNRKIEYLKNPNKCKQCDCPLEYSKKQYPFCSSSCSCTYNNLRRLARTEESKKKTSESLKNKIIPYTKISFCTCEFCNKKFIRNSISNGTKRFCSKECLSKFQSIRQSEYISRKEVRHLYGRGKKSYLESSFEEWLNLNFSTVNFITEKSFKRLDMTKTYFVDFYFPSLNLIIELDGTQHKKTIVYDQERDEYISKTYDVEIIRISYKEYKNKEKLDLIISKLSVSC